VGWPIVPGFDVAGEIERVGDSVTEFKAGDKVYGCTLFGSYSSRILIPKGQMRKIPEKLSFADAASLPAVSLTALYCLSLAGHFPGKNKFSNKAILIHSAAGGVGSMLVQMSKILGLSPIVGVVGSTKKVQEAKHLGCDVVIDKSVDDLWAKAEEAAPDGYKTICDANGVSTLTRSYGHLAQTGRLIIFGFHSNLPMGKHMLSPIEWIRMAKKMNSMPAFDPMDLTVSNKSVLGFNLSFFADEREVVGELFDQICIWLEEEKLRCPRVVTMKMENIGEAHSLIQSGSSVGKIVMEV
jgi:NADPH:quinone reductase-like Zn-dependent oxidoreductase